MAKKQQTSQNQATLSFDFEDSESLSQGSPSLIEPVSTNSALYVTEEKILGVIDLGNLIRDVLDCEKLTNIKVQGEITGLRPTSAGHIYFSLTEKGDKDAAVSCVVWKYSVKNIPFPLKDGLSIVATGNVDFYPSGGRLQFIIKKVEASRKGVAGLYLQKEIWCKELTDAGIIPRPEAERRCFPLFPKCIGVVTSRTGAVLQDIRNVVSRRFPLPILLAPALVQGAGAEKEIVAAIAALQGKVDVIIVARGGGSFEDLFVFNHPDVVKAIRFSVVPIISAIGHETDTTLADFASDLRVPTPSAAAESVVPDRKTIFDGIEESRRIIRDRTSGILKTNRMMLDELCARVDPKRLCRKIDEMHQETADFDERIRGAFERRLILEREGLLRLCGDIAKSTAGVLSRAKIELGAQRDIILARDPEKPLALGYALVYSNGCVLKSVESIRENDLLTLRLADGQVESRVEKIL